MANHKIFSIRIDGGVDFHHWEEKARQDQLPPCPMLNPKALTKTHQLPPDVDVEAITHNHVLESNVPLQPRAQSPGKYCEQSYRICHDRSDILFEPTDTNSPCAEGGSSARIRVFIVFSSHDDVIRSCIWHNL